jgi:hypothetical protein
MDEPAPLSVKGPTSPDANITRLRLAAMEALSAEAGSKSKAQAQLAAADAIRPVLGARTMEAQVWRDTALGAIELDGGDATRALALFTEAADLADRMPETFDESRRLWLRHKQATNESWECPIESSSSALCGRGRGPARRAGKVRVRAGQESRFKRVGIMRV